MRKARACCVGKLPSVLILGASLATLVVVHAQSTKKPMTLTGADYAEIERLSAQYSHAIDTCAENGYAYADLYTSDGAFVDMWTQSAIDAGGVKWQGREKLREISSGANVTGTRLLEQPFQRQREPSDPEPRDHANARRRHGQLIHDRTGRPGSEPHHAYGQLRRRVRQDRQRVALQDTYAFPRAQWHQAGTGRDDTAATVTVAIVANAATEQIG